MARPTNTQFSVAVHLLTLLSGAAPDEMLDSGVLAISPATNPAHVRRVLGHLREGGLVSSHAGARGGWVLTRPAEEIDLAEVWQAVNGADPILGLHTPDIRCVVGRRVEDSLRALDRRALDALLNELRSETIADILRDATTGAAGERRLPVTAAAGRV